jgi:hypothetical protein
LTGFITTGVTICAAPLGDDPTRHAG